MTSEQLDRFFVELTAPDELGITDPRLQAVFDLARRYCWINRQDQILLQINEQRVWLKCGGEVLDRWIDAKLAEKTKLFNAP